MFFFFFLFSVSCDFFPLPRIQIEEDPHLLPNVSLTLRWNDTHGDTVQATKMITQMICEKVAVFFGPEGNTCHTEAIVAQAWNKPMITYVSVTVVYILLLRVRDAYIVTRGKCTLDDVQQGRDREQELYRIEASTVVTEINYV
jgi:hypothetical protein